MADMLSDAQTGIAVLFEEPKEVVSVHEGQLAWLDRLRCQLIRLARDNCV
jgi:hypothetical protein